MAGYISLSENLMIPLQRHISREWVHSNQTNFFYKHVLSRGARLTLAPVSVIVCALDIIIGLGAGVATVATLGMHRPTAIFAGNHLVCCNNLISDPFGNLLFVIHPKAPVAPPLAQGHGLFASPIREDLLDRVNNLRDSNSLLKRHVASRAGYALTALALVIVRISDAILGIAYAPISLLTFGRFETINSMAFYGLQAPVGVVNDLFICMMKTINPWTPIVP